MPKPSEPIRGTLRVLTNQAFLWTIFGIMLVVSGGIAGVGIGTMLLPQTGKPSEKAVTIDPELAGFQWQAILHCLATYLALIPMLYRKKKDHGRYFRWGSRKQTIADVVFYTTVALGFTTAIAAPVVLQIRYHIPEPERKEVYQAAATGLNFASAVFSTAAAGQLAAKVINGRK